MEDKNISKKQVIYIISQMRKPYPEIIMDTDYNYHYHYKPEVKIFNDTIDRVIEKLSTFTDSIEGMAKSTRN